MGSTSLYKRDTAGLQHPAGTLVVVLAALHGHIKLKRWQSRQPDGVVTGHGHSVLASSLSSHYEQRPSCSIRAMEEAKGKPVGSVPRAAAALHQCGTGLRGGLSLETPCQPQPAAPKPRAES